MPQSLTLQRLIHLKPRSRGFHLITPEIITALPELGEIKAGRLDLMLLHTSASLTLNENADPDVRSDMAEFFRRAVPDGAPYFNHILEGSDDMSAHIISSLLGVSLTLQISSGHVVLGTWQGIWLGEHRHRGGSRTVSALLCGERS